MLGLTILLHQFFSIRVNCFSIAVDAEKTRDETD